MSAIARLLTIFVAVATLAACGVSGNDPGFADVTAPDEVPSPSGDLDAWAEGFCDTFLGGWFEDLAAISVAQTGPPPDTVAAARAETVELFETMAGSASRVLADLEVLGPPDADGGEEIHAELVTLFEMYRDASERASAAVVDLDETDPVSFSLEVGEVISRFEAETQDGADALDDFAASNPSPELEAALDRACAQN